MQKNILFGNGINIQYGGIKEYSNKAIMMRLLNNVTLNKYKDVFTGISKDELIMLLNELSNIIKNISKWDKYFDGLFMLMEIERMKKIYDKSTPFEEIGLEDLFIALELQSNAYNDTENFRKTINQELKMLILDAIYNEGAVNRINYNGNFSNLVSCYDNIFTVNYDTNLDRYCNNVKHLHGSFNVLAPEYDSHSEYMRQHQLNNVVKGYEHMFSNAIMSWYWLEKYGQWLDKKSIYGVDEFEKMEGHLDIVGMSPTNDEQLFILINESKLRNVTYFYKSDMDRINMAHKIKKPLTFTKVDKFWLNIENLK